MSAQQEPATGTVDTQIVPPANPGYNRATRRAMRFKKGQFKPIAPEPPASTAFAKSPIKTSNKPDLIKRVSNPKGAQRNG